MFATYTISIDGSVVHNNGVVALFDYENLRHQIGLFIKKYKLKIVRKTEYRARYFEYYCVGNDGTQITITVQRCSNNPSYYEWEW